MASPATDYEAERARRIAENMKRLAELGVVEAVATVAATAAPRRRRAPPRPRAPRAAPGETLPARRSNRLEGRPRATYFNAEDDPEALLRRRRGDGPVRVGRVFVAPQDEVYSQAHIDALGSCAQPWQLFVDGYDAAGNRLYDRERGTTCHQCRQKTLGVHTSCSLCRALRGSFCGDCLYMRYGENAAEAAANPGWVCPPCRGLCNCSFHRAKLGWAATGALYRGAVAAGYPSVAHYLVLNNQAGEGQAVTAPLPRTAAGAASPSRPPRAKVAASPAPAPPTATKKSAPLSEQAAAAAAAAAAALAAPGRRSASFMRQTRVDGAVGRVRRSAGAGKLAAVKDGGVDKAKAKPAAVGLRRSLRGAVTA